MIVKQNPTGDSIVLEDLCRHASAATSYFRFPVLRFQLRRNRQFMARGRKPIQRTKEEAQKARREQVRRNVQAFRQRKNAPKIESESYSDKEKQWTFVEDGLASDVRNLQLVEKGNLSVSDLSLESKSSYLSADLDDQMTRSLPWCSSGPHDTRTHSVRSRRLKNAKNCERLPPEINSAKVSRQQLVSNSAEIFLPGSGLISPQFDQIGPHWIHLLPVMVNKCSVMDTAVQALCLLQITDIEQQRWLYQASRFYYGQALQKLSFALSHNHSTFRKGVFATSIALAIYELFDCISDGQNIGRMVHLRGAASYLERFPSDNDVLGHPISFHFLATVCIFDALRSRKASPYAQSHWWDRSLTMYGGEIYGPLMRMMTLLPPLLEQSDTVLQSPLGTESIDVGLDLLERAFVLESRFNSWLGGTIRSWSTFRFDVQMSTQVLSDSTSTEGEISFPNLFVARLYLLYWSSIIILHGVLSNIESFTKACRGTTRVVPRPLDRGSHPGNERNDSHDFAINIRKSVGFCLQTSHGMIGKSAILLPLWIARHHFEGCNVQEARYCSGVLKKLGQDDGKNELPEHYSFGSDTQTF